MENYNCILSLITVRWRKTMCRIFMAAGCFCIRSKSFLLGGSLSLFSFFLDVRVIPAEVWGQKTLQLFDSSKRPENVSMFFLCSPKFILSSCCFSSYSLFPRSFHWVICLCDFFPVTTLLMMLLHALILLLIVVSLHTLFSKPFLPPFSLFPSSGKERVLL